MQGWSGGVSLFSSFPFARWLISRHSYNKLFVGGLSYDTNESVLKEAFRQHGETIEVKVICDHVSGKSTGYTFVQLTSETAASTAMREMDGQIHLSNLLLDGRNIRMQHARKGEPKELRTRIISKNPPTILDIHKLS